MQFILGETKHLALSHTRSLSDEKVPPIPPDPSILPA